MGVVGIALPLRSTDGPAAAALPTLRSVDDICFSFFSPLDVCAA